MKKQTLNFSLPARMTDFVTDESNPCFSRGKLNIFYKGLTADGRLFDEEFSNALLPTAAYAPVVGYYDREQEDFVGHAPEQAIYGIVDPKIEPVFETLDDGNVWAVVDVVLYTERPGEVGEIAKKIVGHKQSLELNPETVKYKINYDEKKHFKNLQFTEGHIIGVSVLGENQSPAFTGSAFFSKLDECFEEKMQLLKDYCNHSLTTENNTKEKDSEMSVNKIDFMELSWENISEKVATAITREYENDGWVIPCDTFDGHMIVCVWYYSGDRKYLDINYSCSDNGEVTLGDVFEVRPTYELVDKKDEVNVEPSFAATDDNVADNVATQEEPVNEEAPQAGNDEGATADNFENSADSQSQDPETVVTDNFAATDNEVQGQENSDSASSTDGEPEAPSNFENQQKQQEQLQQREEKVELITAYKDYLSDALFSSFVTNVDGYDFQSLENELLKIYKAYKTEEESKQQVRAFYNPMMSCLDNNSTNYNSDDIGHIVAKVLNK